MTIAIINTALGCISRIPSPKRDVHAVLATFHETQKPNKLMPSAKPNDIVPISKLVGPTTPGVCIFLAAIVGRRDTPSEKTSKTKTFRTILGFTLVPLLPTVRHQIIH